MKDGFRQSKGDDHTAMMLFSESVALAFVGWNFGLGIHKVTNFFFGKFNILYYSSCIVTNFIFFWQDEDRKEIIMLIW